MIEEDISFLGKWCTGYLEKEHIEQVLKQSVDLLYESQSRESMTTEDHVVALSKAGYNVTLSFQESDNKFGPQKCG